MDSYVLDASAILAFINQEAGSERVEASVADAQMSTVNMAEVGTKLSLKGLSVQSVRSTLASLPIEIVPFDEEHAIETARLAPVTASAGLSLGDRACLALAHLRGLPVLTGDRRWATVDVGVQVVLFR